MYRILGPLQVELHGRAHELAGHRQRALLIALLIHANEVVSTDRLVDELWRGEPPRTAITSLHNAVSKLRRELGDVLVTHPAGYVLEVARADVDALAFEDLVRAARDREPAERAAMLREALALWRGSPLLDVAYEPFAAATISRLEELRLVAQEDLIDAELEQGLQDRVLPELETLVAQNPLRERLWGQLMLAQYRSGRQGDALQTYHDARRAIVDELGIEPGPALRQLHGAVIRQEADLKEGARERRAAPGREDLSDVLGALTGGRLVPVLGEASDGLAGRLAERFHYPPSEPTELARVSQYAAATRGYGPLHDELRDWVLAADEPGAVHRFFASLPPLLRARGAPHQLLVTTSYGSALEHAFAAAAEEVDVVSYVASGPGRGKFSHLAPDGSTRLIESPNIYAEELSLDRRTIILKVRGRIDPLEAAFDGIVVTEDDYLEYLRRADVASGVPVSLAATLRRSHFLFLGYTVRDWALRLVLGRLWGDEPVAYRSWAVHPEPGPAERELWRRLDVDLIETPIEHYVQGLSDALGASVEATA